MHSPSVEAFLASLKRCLAVPGFMDDFYQRFMGSSAEVREKFKSTDMKRQAQVLADTLYVVANAVQGEERPLMRYFMRGVTSIRAAELRIAQYSRSSVNSYEPATRYPAHRRQFCGRQIFDVRSWKGVVRS